VTTLPYLQRPSRPLPRTVTPVLDETLDSYTRRLAHANRLDPHELRDFITGDKRKNAIFRAEFLAILAGTPVRTLQYAILELCTDQDRATMSLSGRPRPGRRQAQMCRGCAAAAGAKEPVTRWRRHEDVLCQRHKRWTEGSGHRWTQPNLAKTPEILGANRLHRRLIRRHGREAALSGFAAAERICATWHERSRHDNELHQLMERLLGPDWSADRDDPVIAAARYPQAIALARLLASPYWKGLATREHLATGMPDYGLISGLTAEIYNEMQAGHLDARMSERQHNDLLSGRYLALHPGTRAFTEEVRRTAATDYRFNPFSSYGVYTPITEWVRDELNRLRHPEHRIRWTPETYG
jgi:hypothetical protein